MTCQDVLFLLDRRKMRLFLIFLVMPVEKRKKRERKKKSTVVLKWFPQAIKVVSLPQHVGG